MIDASRSIFTRFTERDFEDYLALCSSLHPDFNVAEMRRRSVYALRYYKGDRSARAGMRTSMLVEERWYQSLLTGRPDYSVYADDHFAIEAWCCWVIYSRKCMRQIASVLPSLGKIETAVDIGCGIGYTTAALREVFGPACSVWGTNVEGLQYDVAQHIGRSYGFGVLTKVEHLPRGADLVLASEYFEHWERPTDHLHEVLVAARPKVLVIANSFGAQSVGHFNHYKFGQESIPAKLTGRRFNRALVDAGYKKMETGFWNNRPSIWRRA